MKIRRFPGLTWAVVLLSYLADRVPCPADSPGPADDAAPFAESVDGTQIPGRLVAVGPGWQWQLEESQTNQSHTLKTMWSWGRWSGRFAAPQLMLTDATVLTLSDPLGRGPAVDLGSNRIRIQTQYFGDVQLPLALVAAVVWIWPAALNDRDRLSQRLLVHSEQALVATVTGDELAGSLRSWSSDFLEIQDDQRIWKVPRNRLMWIRPARAAQDDLPPASRSAFLALQDGSILHVRKITLRDGHLKAVTVGGLDLASRPGHSMDSAIEHVQMVDDAVVRLDELGPAQFQYWPWVDLHYGLGVNQTQQRGRLRCRNATYRFGLAMHAPARAEYHLDQPARWFVSQLGLDASTGNEGSVRFRVWMRPAPGSDWQLGYESDLIRGNEAPRRCRVNLLGASDLALEVDVADHGHVLDRAIWLDARLVPPQSEGPRE